MAVHKTKALFWETSTDREKDQPIWTLKLEDSVLKGKEYKSAYQIYMNANSEYEAAMTICNGNYHHWEHLCSVKWFMKGGIHPAVGHIGLEAWRNHKHLKDIDEQIKNLKNKAEDGDTAAAKAIIQLYKEAEKTSKAGRPKKDKEDPMVSNIKNFMKRVK